MSSGNKNVNVNVPVVVVIAKLESSGPGASGLSAAKSPATAEVVVKTIGDAVTTVTDTISKKL